MLVSEGIEAPLPTISEATEDYCITGLKSIKVRGPKLGGLGFIRELAQHLENKNQIGKAGLNEFKPK